MINKIITGILSILLCFAFFSFSLPLTAVSASDNFDARQIAYDFMYQDGEEIRINRRAGSEGELETAGFIQQYMITNASSFIPINGDIQGFQYFSFLDSNQEMKSSQNLIFNKKGNSNKKVIIATSYDNLYGEKLFSGQENLSTGFDEVVSGVVALLDIAQKLNEIQMFEFDVEIVFFGAENAGLHGSSFYTKQIDKLASSNILLFIDLNNLAGNGQLNIFSSDANYKFSSDFASILNLHNNKELFKSFRPLFNITNQLNSLDLKYSHIGMQSSILNFNRLGIPSINIFGGDYSGLPLFDENKAVLDTYDSYVDNYGSNYLSNAMSVSSTLVAFLSNSNLNNLTVYQGKTKSGSFWTDERVPTAVALCIFIILLVLYFIFNDKLRMRFLIALSKNETRMISVKEIFETFSNEIEGKDLSKSEISEKLNEIIRNKIKNAEVIESENDDVNINSNSDDSTQVIQDENKDK